MESRWNLMLASTTNGSGMAATSSRAGDVTASSPRVITISSTLDTNCRRPSCTSSWSESTSEVIRLTMTPAFSRS